MALDKEASSNLCPSELLPSLRSPAAGGLHQPAQGGSSVFRTRETAHSECGLFEKHSPAPTPLPPTPDRKKTLTHKPIEKHVMFRPWNQVVTRNENSLEQCVARAEAGLLLRASLKGDHRTFAALHQQTQAQAQGRSSPRGTTATRFHPSRNPKSFPHTLVQEEASQRNLVAGGTVHPSPTFFRGLGAPFPHSLVPRQLSVLSVPRTHRRAGCCSLSCVRVLLARSCFPVHSVQCCANHFAGSLVQEKLITFLERIGGGGGSQESRLTVQHGREGNP